MQHNEKVRKIFATAIVIAIVAIVIFASARYFTALFGAFLLFFLFRPIYNWFHGKKKFPKGLSASLVITIIILGVIIPLSFGITLVVQEVSSGLSDATALLENIAILDERIPNVDLTGLVEEQYDAMGSYARSLLLSIVNDGTRILISLVITFFVLYFMLVESEKMNKNIMKYVPFNKKNSERLWLEFKNVTHATVVSTGLIALMQGVLMGICFVVFGIKGALFLGFISVLISFLPLVGVPLIWIPVAIIQLLSQDYVAGIGILIWGSIVSTIDNFIRPYIQNKVGQIHPLTTVIGVFIGLPVFGLMGLILGPLLLSYAILITTMYMEEFV